MRDTVGLRLSLRDAWRQETLSEGPLGRIDFPSLSLGEGLRGLSNGGLGYLSSNACNCHHFATKIPFTKGPKRPRICTIAHNCGRTAESGLEPPLV